MNTHAGPRKIDEPSRPVRRPAETVTTPQPVRADVAQMLQLQATAGNSAVGALLGSSSDRRPKVQRQQSAPVVMREPAAPAIKMAGTEFSYPVSTEVKIDRSIPKCPVKLKSMKISVAARAKFASTAKPEEGNGPTVATGSKFGGDKQFEAAVKGELGTLGEAHKEVLHQKLKADAKMEYAAQGAPGEIKTGLSMTGSVQDESLKGTPLEKLQASGEISLFEVDWKSKTAKVPEISGPKLSLGASYETPPIDHVFASVGQTGALSFSGSVVFEFEPDWAQIIEWLAEEIGADTLATVAAPAALAAAGVAITYFTLKDMDRQEQLAFKVRQSARGIVKAGGIYSMVMSGDRKPQPIGKFEADAYATAQADLARVAQQRKIDKEVYLGIMGVPEFASPVLNQTADSYVTAALGHLESQVDGEIDTWHSDHMWQTFWSGRYASADKAMANQIITEEQANQGNPTIG